MWFTVFWRAVVAILPGLGVAWAADKILPGKVPNYEPTGISTWSVMKIISWVVLLAIGAILIKFIGKKLNVKLFK
jgi:hypothetical protein